MLAIVFHGQNENREELLLSLSTPEGINKQQPSEKKKSKDPSPPTPSHLWFLDTRENKREKKV